MVQSWKRSSGHRKVALVARWTQIASSCVITLVVLISIRSNNIYVWDTTPLYICMGVYSTATSAILGSLGLVALRKPEKIHWHVMATLDGLAFAAMFTALWCVLYTFDFALWITGIIAVSIGLIANLTIVGQTARPSVRRTLAGGLGKETSTSVEPKSLKDDELWPSNLRAFDLEEQNVRPSQSSQAPLPKANHATASQDIADQILAPSLANGSSEHEDQHHSHAEPDDRSSTSAQSLSEICHWSITSGTLTGGGSSVRSTAPSYEK